MHALVWGAGDALERVVAAIWEEVLHVERVGALDDFFSLGGHSLLSTRVLVRVRTAFDVDVPLQHIFRDPTVRGLATSIRSLAVDPAAIERTAELLWEVSSMDDDQIEAELGGGQVG